MGYTGFTCANSPLYDKGLINYPDGGKSTLTPTKKGGGGKSLSHAERRTHKVVG